MESNSFLPNADDFKNNKIKECPFCNALLPLSEYDDHLFCHTIDQQENGQNMNINNYGINNQQNINNGPSQSSSNNNMNYFNNNNNNNSINFNNNNDNNFSIFEENNNNQNQHYINPQLQNLNNINYINQNNNQNRINNNLNNINNNNQINNQNRINNNNQNNINNNQNRINNNINNNNQNNINNNQNRINNNENNNNNSQSIFDKFKSNFSYFLSNIPNPFQNKDQNQNNNEVPPENLSEEERNRLEEQKAYEKKILGIMHENSQIRVQDPRSTGQKIKDYFESNPDRLLAVVDVVGCLVLNGPSIGRTIMRVGRFVGDNIASIGSGGNDNDNDANENINSEEYQNMVRNHPELRKKNKDVETIIKFLPISIVKEIRENGNNNNNENNRKCVICLSDFEVGEEVTALPCLHVFHTECISSWIKKHCQCPVCKFDVTIQSLIGGH